MIGFAMVPLFGEASINSEKTRRRRQPSATTPAPACGRSTHQEETGEAHKLAPPAGVGSPRLGGHCHRWPGQRPTIGADPPGNNGTIKIDNPPPDNAPNNEPHVACEFQVDFYGYDEGDLFADVTFRAHPPTGNGEVLLTDTVFIGEDDNSGGGSEAGHDASADYTLDFTGFTPHPQQGFHVKLTINADGSQGADKKHKVFWVEECPKPPPPPKNGNGEGNGEENGKEKEGKKPAESPAPVPTAVPAGSDAAGGGSTAPLGLILAGSAALAGAAAVSRRRFLHHS
jgi:hypothetical protein